MKKILFIFGTRPEAIKLASIIRVFKKHPNYQTKICLTAQHRQMVDQVIDFFDLKADFDLNLMKPDQTLAMLTSKALEKLDLIITKEKPQLVIVQGDTTSAFIGALSAFYHQVPVVHIEAGLRSGKKNSPFPEEINRVLISRLADYHFAPTSEAKNNLLKEGIKKNVWVVGNSVIDALKIGLEIIKSEPENDYRLYFKSIDFNKKIILITGHRRESFGKPFEEFCQAIKQLSKNQELEIVYPVHLNPNVRRPVEEILHNIHNIHLIDPLDYPRFISLMSKAYLVITDSGGVQEEAPALGKPVIVTREVTERSEGIKSGNAILTGTNRKKIITTVDRLVNSDTVYKKMARTAHLYGTGKSAEKIFKILNILMAVNKK